MQRFIFGTGNFAFEIARIFEKYGITIDSFINVKDKNKVLPCSVYKDIPVCYVDDLDVTAKDVNIFIAKKSMFMGSGIELFRKNQLNNIFIVNEEIFFNEIGSIDELKKYIEPIDLSYPFLNYLETNIVDNCNLNCKGCAHFSNICDPRYVDINSFEQDLKKITEHFYLYNFRLLGGEPLLHPRLKDIIEISRKYLPNSRLVIVTNGLLLDKLSPELLRCMFENNVIVTISLYMPTFSKIDNIISILKQYGIKYLINDDYFKTIEPIKSFHTRLSETKNVNNYDANKSCSGRFCRFIRDGKISKCYLPLLIDEVNKKYGKNFEVSNEDYISIYDLKDGWDAIDMLNGDIPFCQYCRDELFEFDWKCGHKNDNFDSFVLKKTK